MVYSALVMALASGHPVSGGLTMLAFGLGTLPNLLALEVTQPVDCGRASSSARFASRPGALIVAFGLLGLVRSSSLLHEALAPLTHGAHDHVRASH